MLAAAAERLYTTDGDRELYDLALDVERTALRLLAEHKPGRNLQTNVEFYTALLLHGLGLPTELFTPTFAVGRVAGWTAHCFEQRALDRLIRPQSEYVGREGQKLGAAGGAVGGDEKRPPEKSGGRTLLSVTQVSRFQHVRLHYMGGG